MYHTRALVVLDGLPVMSENKMSDKPQTRVDILTTSFNSPSCYLLYAPTSIRVWHKAVFRWVRSQKRPAVLKIPQCA